MFRVTVAAVAVLLITLTAPVVAQAAEGKPLVLGSVHPDAAKQFKIFLPFARHLAGELAADGIGDGKVIVTRATADMVDLLKAGKVDLYMDSPLVMMEANRLSGSRTMLRRWKKGAPDYQSVIFVRKDSGLTTLADLKGKVLAFQAPDSSTGYILPWLLLHRAGLTAKELRTDATRPASGTVGYVFSGADTNTLAWVLYGRVAAGGTSRDDLEEASPEQLAQFAVIAESVKIPRHVVAHRADLPAPLVARIKSVLLTMDQSEAGLKALAAFERTARFDEIPPHYLEELARLDEILQATQPGQ